MKKIAPTQRTTRSVAGSIPGRRAMQLRQYPAVYGLRKTPEPALQRVILHNLGGSIDDTMYEKRKERNDFIPGKNKGWIRIQDTNGNVTTYYAQSEYGQAHTEENLIQIATDLGVNLAIAPGAPLNQGARVTEMYTERQPCNNNNADDARKLRGQGNCGADLQATLHNNVVVHYSVPNSKAHHMNLLGRQSIRKKVEGEMAFLHKWTLRCTRRMIDSIRKETGIQTTGEQNLEWVLEVANKMLAPKLQSLRRYLGANDMDFYNYLIEAIEQDTILAQLEIEEFCEQYAKFIVKKLISVNQSGKKKLLEGNNDDEGNSGGSGKSTLIF